MGGVISCVYGINVIGSLYIYWSVCVWGTLGDACIIYMLYCRVCVVCMCGVQYMCDVHGVLCMCGILSVCIACCKCSVVCYLSVHYM